MSISLDGGDGSVVKKYLAQHNFTIPTVHDNGMRYARKIGARGVPMTFIIDRKQNIIYSAIGPLNYDHVEFKKIMANLLIDNK
jgi:hypothetical protein